MRTSLLAGAAVALAVAAAGPAKAQITPGSTLTFTGVADATDVGLPGVVLDFTQPVVASATGNTGTFALLNKRSGPGISGQLADFRVGNGPESVANFLTLGGYRFSLSGLPSGPYGQDACYIDPAPGQTCTPFQSVQGNPTVNDGLSPFYVANAASANPDGTLNSTASFDLFGTVTGPGGATSSFVGTITSSFIGLPYQYVLYGLEQQGIQGLPFTATFTTRSAVARHNVADLGEGLETVAATVTPEPATVGLVFAGLLGVAGAARRRRARKVA